MVTAIAKSAQPQPATEIQKPSPASSLKSTPPKPQPSASKPVDTVQISSAAQAALQEATETPEQTAKEGRGGDGQAQRLLAREAAAK